MLQSLHLRPLPVNFICRNLLQADHTPAVPDRTAEEDIAEEDNPMARYILVVAEAARTVLEVVDRMEARRRPDTDYAVGFHNSQARRNSPDLRLADNCPVADIRLEVLEEEVDCIAVVGHTVAVGTDYTVDADSGCSSVLAVVDKSSDLAAVAVKGRSMCCSRHRNRRGGRQHRRVHLDRQDHPSVVLGAAGHVVQELEVVRSGPEVDTVVEARSCCNQPSRLVMSSHSFDAEVGCCSATQASVFSTCHERTPRTDGPWLFPLPVPGKYELLADECPPLE